MCPASVGKPQARCSRLSLVGHLVPCPGWHTTAAREGLALGQAAALGGSLGLLPPGSATLCPSQMSYELWQDLEEESEGDGQGRKPEIGHVFLMDRGTLEQGGQRARDRPRRSGLGRQLARRGRELQEARGGWLRQLRPGRAVAGREGGQGRHEEREGSLGTGSRCRHGLRDGAVLPGGVRGAGGRHLPHQVR